MCYGVRHLSVRPGELNRPQWGARWSTRSELRFRTVRTAGGNPDSNTLISDMTTVICLDDYHSLDRNGRKVKGVTALAPEAQHFDLM